MRGCLCGYRARGGGCCRWILVFVELSPLLSLLTHSGRKIHGKEGNIDLGAVDRCYCLQLLLLVLIRGECWGMLSPSADDGIIALWGGGSAGNIS